MSYNKGKISEGQLTQLFSIEENHFNDFKSKDISGRQFSKIVSALANASGGDVYIGIREENTTKLKHWEGFKNVEDANSLIQVVESLTSIENYYDLEFLQHPVLMTYILKFTIKNGTGRTVTGIKSENTMKNVFYRLRDRGFIQLIHGYNYWKKTDAFERLVHEQFKNLLAEQKE